MAPDRRMSFHAVLTAHRMYILIEGKFIDVYKYHKMIIVGPYYTLFLSHFPSVIIVAMLEWMLRMADC